MSDNKKYFTDHINETLSEIGLRDSVTADDIVDIIDGYKGLGYGLSTPEELGLVVLLINVTSLLKSTCVYLLRTSPHITAFLEIFPFVI